MRAWRPRALWRHQLAARHWAALTHPVPVARMATEFVNHIEGARLDPG